MKKTNNGGVLIAVATYNEVNNVTDLLVRIRDVCGDSVDILVVDDNSPDGTSEIISRLQFRDENLHLLKRKKKLGLGSAQKAIIVYSIIHKYNKLVSLDADLSHSPEDIPRLLTRSENGSFVIGSRYSVGGSTSTAGIRNIVSRIGNLTARFAIGTNLHEVTTSFRVYDVNRLRTIPISKITSSCYAFFVESIFLLKQAGVDLLEEPIHFSARKNDTSKMPRSQILSSSWSLLKMVSSRLMRKRQTQTEKWWSTSSCHHCGGNLLILKTGRTQQITDQSMSKGDSLKSVAIQSGGTVFYECLICGLTQTGPPKVKHK